MLAMGDSLGASVWMQERNITQRNNRERLLW